MNRITNIGIDGIKPMAAIDTINPISQPGYHFALREMPRIGFQIHVNAFIVLGMPEQVDNQAQDSVLVGHDLPETSAPSDAPNASTEEALSATNLVVHGRAPVELTVYKGEIVGLAGLVGSGRTRLARALIGDVRSTGTIKIGGRKVGRLTPERATRAGLALVPEDRKVSGLALGASVEANIVVSALGKLMSVVGLVRPGSRPRLATQMIKRFVIRPPDRKKLVGNLSGGNAQKVLLARAVGSKPVAMILDQPTAGVDIGAKAELHNQIRLSARQGAGILVISDDLDELLELSDRILVVNSGVVTGNHRKADLTPASLLADMSRSTTNG